MRALRQTVLMLLAVAAGLSLEPVRGPAVPGGAQKPSTPPAEVLKTESNLVLVDVIATDKKGNYIRDLERRDFRVYQDDKEQTISTFSRPSDIKTTGPDAVKHYLILFFDNSTIETSNQVIVRREAAQFVAKAASPDRLIAVVDFGGLLRISQNFTNQTALLEHAVQGVKFSALQPNAGGPQTELASLASPSLGARSLEHAGNDFAARSVLLSIRSLCKSLHAVPGRKTLILFSGGFPLSPEREAELTATIDAANKANVAIYPIDVRGLTNLSPNPFPEMNTPSNSPGFPPGAGIRDVPFPHEEGLLASLMALPLPGQRPSGGGGAGGGAPGRGGAGGGSAPPGGGGGTGGGGGGGRGGGGIGNPGSPGGPAPGGSVGNPTGNGGRGGPTGPSNTGFGGPGFPNNQPPQIIPPMLETTSTNQQVLYALATGTGGFTIFNTNDFLKGMNKVTKDLDEYYVLGYVPPNQTHDGSYHSIKVKIERHGIEVRARNGYYDVKSPDLLAGKPEGKALEADAASLKAGAIPISMNAPYFYTSPHVARVDLALEIPGSSLQFRKEKGKFHYEVNILGIAYLPDGAVGARFSDTAKGDLDKKEEKQLTRDAFDYQNAFDIAPGKYRLTVVLSAGGQEFGKYELPLAIAPYSGKEFSMSAVAMSDSFHPTSQLTANLDRALLEERTPLVAHGVQVTPSPDNRFAKEQQVGFYVEVYEPLLESAEPPRVGLLFDIYNSKTDQRVLSSNTILLNDFMEGGNPVIPVALRLPVSDLAPGKYRLQLRARDSFGNATPVESANFSIE